MKANDYMRKVGVGVSCIAISVMGSNSALADETVTANPNIHKASDTIGMELHDSAGEDIGSVLDVVLDRDQRRIAYAIVSYGGFLGVGDKHFAVPWGALKQQDDYVTLNIAKDRLEKAPGFEAGELPDTADPMFHQSIHGFYGVAPYSLDPHDRVHGAAGNEVETGTTDATANNSTQNDSEYDWKGWTLRDNDSDWFRRLSELIGTGIENPRGDYIAEIEDVIIDSGESRATYALVSYGGTLGFFEDTAAVPWDALKLKKEQEVYILDATEQQLESAKINAENLTKLDTVAFRQSLDDSFKTKNLNAQGDADRSAETSLSGIVESVGTYSDINATSDQLKDGVRLRLRTDKGDYRTVHLTDRKQLRDQNCSINKGDQVSLEGYEKKFHSYDVFQATKIMKDGKTITLVTGPNKKTV